MEFQACKTISILMWRKRKMWRTKTNGNVKLIILFFIKDTVFHIYISHFNILITLIWVYRRQWNNTRHCPTLTSNGIFPKFNWNFFFFFLLRFYDNQQPIYDYDKTKEDYFHLKDQIKYQPYVIQTQGLETARLLHFCILHLNIIAFLLNSQNWCSILRRSPNKLHNRMNLRAIEKSHSDYSESYSDCWIEEKIPLYSTQVHTAVTANLFLFHWAQTYFRHLDEKHLVFKNHKSDWPWLMGHRLRLLIHKLSIVDRKCYRNDEKQ